jgi:hypothetical protein
MRVALVIVPFAAFATLAFLDDEGRETPLD